MAFFEPILHAFGLDIGDRSIKAVDLAPPLMPRKATRMLMRSWNQLAVPEGVIEGGEIRERKALTALLSSVIRTASPRRIRGANVIASLPESKTFVKTIEIPRVEPSKIPEAIAAETEQHIPMPLADASFDWQVLGTSEAGDRLRVIVGAVHKEIAESYAAAIEDAGLTPFALEIEAVAIARSLLSAPTNRAGAMAIIDMGATRSSFIVTADDAILLTINIPLSGNDMTARISERLQLDWNDAEKMKIACGLDPTKCAVKLRTLVEDLLAELVDTIRKAIRFARTHVPEGKYVEGIMLTGGGANIAKLENILSQKLLLKVRSGNPAAGLSLPKKFPAAQSNSFSTAIGLALRAAAAAKTVLEQTPEA